MERRKSRALAKLEGSECFMIATPDNKKRKRSSITPQVKKEVVSRQRKDADDTLSGYYAQYANINGFNNENYLKKLTFETTMVTKTLNGDQGAYLDDALRKPLTRDNAIIGDVIWTWWPYKDDVINEETGTAEPRNGHFRRSKLIRLREESVKFDSMYELTRSTRVEVDHKSDAVMDILKDVLDATNTRGNSEKLKKAQLELNSCLNNNGENLRMEAAKRDKERILDYHRSSCPVLQAIWPK